MNSPLNPTSPTGPDKPLTATRRFSLRNVLRVLLCLVVSVATLVALLYVVENWRGKHAWAAYEKELTAKGVSLDFASVVPPPVPDDQNFAATPFLAPLFDFEPGTQTWRDRTATTNRMQFASKLPDFASVQNRDWRLSEKTDWPAFAAAFGEAARKAARRSSDAPQDTAQLSAVTNRLQAVADVLEALKEYDPVLAELRVASRRAHARFNIRYEEENPAGILLPHLAMMKSFVRILSLRAGAELALGRTGPAMNDLDLAFYLTDTCRGEPFLISPLVRCALVWIIMQPVWEGLADRQWSDAQLASIEERLGKFDFLADGRRALHTEQVFGNRIIDYVRNHPQTLENIGSPEAGDRSLPPSGWVNALIPRGWFYQEQVNYNRCFQDFVRPGVDVESRRVHPQVIEQNEKAVEQSLRGGVSPLLGHRILAAMLVPAIPQSQRKFAHAQTMVDAAVVACALGRYRLASGQFPDSLAALTPKYLEKPPHDLITGEPLKYRPENDGFVLYSVGWNVKDDGGTVTMSGKKTSSIDLTQGDWVFRVP